MELGDNPSADGFPLTLGWECDFKTKLTLDDYETSKPLARSRQEFWMPAQYRESVLSNQGITASEMLRTTKEMKKIQKSRNKSINSQKWDTVHLMMEESKHKLKGVSSLRRIASTSIQNSESMESSCKTSTSQSKISKSTSTPTLLSLSMFKSTKEDCSSTSTDPLDEPYSSRLDLHRIHIPQEEEGKTEELLSTTEAEAVEEDEPVSF